MGKDFIKKSGIVFLMAVQLQSIFWLGKAPIKVIQFQFFLFILTLEILFSLIRSKP